MKVITRLTKAKDTLERWIERIENTPFEKENIGILLGLTMLGNNPDPDDIDRVIGNSSWTRTECDHCGAENVDVVEVGGITVYEDDAVHLCKQCLESALELINGHQSSES